MENVLFKFLADVNKPKDIKMFFRDFLKPSEYELLIKRIGIIYFLSKKRGYKNIKSNLKVSSATIASMQNSMKTKGVLFAIKNIKAEEWASKWAKKIKSFKLTK